MEGLKKRRLGRWRGKRNEAPRAAPEANNLVKVIRHKGILIYRKMNSCISGHCRSMARLAITKLLNYTFGEYTYQPCLLSLSSTRGRELSLRHSLPKSTNLNIILTKLLDAGYSRLFGRKTGRIVSIIEVTRIAKPSPAG